MPPPDRLPPDAAMPSGPSPASAAHSDRRPWYADVTAYQWTVLAIASLGWVFDVFEGQLFVASMNQAMPALAPAGSPAGTIEFYKDVTNGCFLLGGALGGVLFGILSDRIGRTRTMVYTILMYSLFTSVSAASQAWWHMAIFRFLVAMGVGGEWAVASALVAEVFPQRARAHSLGIFHASSVLGTFLAVVAGAFVVPNLGWRASFLLGALPALLTLWVRLALREPSGWKEAQVRAQNDRAATLGRVADLFRPPILRNTLVGVGLATIGLTTFWGAHIFGKDLFLRDARQRYLKQLPADASPPQREALLKDHAGELKRWEMAGMFLVTTGGGLGLLLFGPLAERIGRRGAFALFHAGALLVALFTFQYASGLGVLSAVLPVFGFLTLGMHAGYAIYFPELFPTRLRATGAGLCFNLARLAVFPMLVLPAWLQRPSDQGGLALSRENAASLLSLLFIAGAVIVLFARETRGQELPG